MVGESPELTELSLEELLPPPQAQGESRFARLAPLGLVALVIAYVLYEIRWDASVVPYVNDSAMHSEMVRFATNQIEHLRLPLTSWFPNLGLGSPQFLHYQSLPAMLTGAIGILIGPNRAFALALYLLVACWPISVYAGARLFEFDRWQAAAVAVMAPFITSTINVGYEQFSYIWNGYGVWTQLFAMWTLPLAWGFTWQAVHRRRHVTLALLFAAVTVAFHFETGYLAFAAVIVWPFLVRAGVIRRASRGALVFVGIVGAAAWVIVPLQMNAHWAAVDEFLQQTPDADSYGARRVLSWLLEGKLFDDGRWPVLTIALGIGLVVCIFRWRADVRVRPVFAMFFVSLVLFFGRPTLGPLLDLLPGSKDLFVRRFIIGVHLAGLFVAGYGTVELLRLVSAVTKRRLPRLAEELRSSWRRPVAWGALFLALAALLAPAWTQIESEDVQDAANIQYQLAADTSVGPSINAIIDKIRALGGGRTYAGLPSNWGASFEVGYVPMYKYLAWSDIDEVGYTTRTASLMTDPEAYFDESNPADYEMFAVRFLILPVGHPAPISGVHRLLTSGNYQLYETKVRGYLQLVDTVPGYPETRANIGAENAWFMYSDLASSGYYPTIGYGGAPIEPATTGGTGPLPKGSPGTVVDENDDLLDGRVSATVDVRRTSVALLKVSYDPGWTVTIDGVPAPTEIVAPAMLGVRVTPGVHHLVFAYRGYRYYPELAGVLVVTLAVAEVVDLRLRRRRRLTD